MPTGSNPNPIPIPIPNPNPNPNQDNADWIESWLQWAITKKKAENMISEGDSIVLVHGWKSGEQSLSTYRVITVE